MENLIDFSVVKISEKGMRGLQRLILHTKMLACFIYNKCQWGIANFLDIREYDQLNNTCAEHSTDFK